MGRIELFPSDWDEVDITRVDHFGIVVFRIDGSYILINTQIIEPATREFIHKYHFDRVKLEGIECLSDICICANWVRIKNCSSAGNCAVVADMCKVEYCAGVGLNIIANYVEVSLCKLKISGLIGVIRHHRWNWDTIKTYRDDVPTAHVFIVGGVISPATQALGDELGIVFACPYYKDEITIEFINTCKALVVLQDLM